jgi:ADP-ribose pyrophosphatase YjhB (NUDIX family)
VKGSQRHPIQLAILERLRLAPEGLRYARIRPEQVENDLYNYHLQYLIKEGLVAKKDDRYVLATDGKKYVVELNPLTDRFKLAAVALLTRQGKNGLEILYQQRLRQPFVGEQSLVGTGIRRGELAHQAAARCLMTKAGLAAEFKLFGLMRKIKFDKQGDLYSDILFHICISDQHEGELMTRNEYGEHGWLTLEGAIAAERKPAGSKQFAQILKQLHATDPAKIGLFYIEEFYHLDIY